MSLFLFAAGLAFVLALGSGTASAQTDTDNPYVDNEVQSQGIVADGSEVLSNSVSNADPDTSGALAFTGTEIAFFAAIGSGLVVLGTVMTVGSRRRHAANI